MAAMLGGCGQPIPPHMKPLSAETRALLASKGMREEAPIFIRIFKQESELEVWKQKDDGSFALFKTYPICNWSGDLGPKEREGDKQAPEGFYTVTASRMNPNSAFYLSFNLGFPNAYDKAYGRTGAHLMVHGDCKSAGCYAMTDALIEEIYLLAREAFKGGQQAFHVHAFPFRMTDAKLSRYRNHKWYGFWRNLKQGYDYFEVAKRPPAVEVCERRYLVNAAFIDSSARPDPRGACPAYRTLPIEALPPPPAYMEAQAPRPAPAQSAPPQSTSAAAAPTARPMPASYSTPAPTQSRPLGGDAMAVGSIPRSPAPAAAAETPKPAVESQAAAAAPTPAAAATAGQGTTFTFAPAKPTTSSFAFRPKTEPGR